ncbi:hypothetical protein [Paeniglutamicibacter psychrophenolicus]
MAFDYEAGLDQALRRRGGPMSAQDFITVVEEVTNISAEPLTAGEVDFLMKHTDLTEADLSPHGRAKTHLRVLAERSRSRALLDEASLSTAEVAALLGRDPANIRRSRLEGDLYSPGVGVPGQSLRFPKWQFVDNTYVRGLRKIIPAFPDQFHPLSIERFMTEPNDELHSMSPVQWLVSGGDPDAVAKLADELGYE